MKNVENELVSVQSVGKSLGGFEILRGIDLSVSDNEFLVIMGESGSGKSTLLSLLGGLDFCDRGRIQIQDYELSPSSSEKDLLEYRTSISGFVYQDFNLIPTLTVEENITLPAEFSGIAYNPKRVDELLDRFGLSKRRDRFPETLSGGEMQRTAIARSILLRPKLLLADEPTGNLDSMNSEEVMKIFREIHGQGTCIILVTHSKKIASFGTRLVEMANGGFIGA